MIGKAGLPAVHPGSLGLFGDIDPQVGEPAVHRRSRLKEDLHHWLERVGLPYHSAHKFSHGQATYAVKRCKDVADLQPVSQNLMHSRLEVTDSTYSVLSDRDVSRRIASLTHENGLGDQTITGAVVMRPVEETLQQLKT
jgi:hypothetical protein